MELASVKVYPLANSGLTPMQNWNTTNVTNALGVSTSTVTESYTVDEFGMQKDWPDAKPVITGELYGDGRSYVDMNDMVISGDFEIDILTTEGVREAVNRDLVVFSNGSSEVVRVGYGYYQQLSVYTLGIRPSYIDTSHPVAITIKRNGDTVTVYKSLLYKNSTQVLELYDQTTDIACAVDLTVSGIGKGVYTNVFNNIVGTTQITQGTRTDEQRAKDIQKLATKHGVII